MHKAASGLRCTCLRGFAAVPWVVIFIYYVLCIPLLVPIPDPRLLLESGRSEVEGERPAEARLRSKKKFEAREEQGLERAPGPLRPASQPADSDCASVRVTPRAREQETDSPVGPGEMRAGQAGGFLEFRGLRITQYIVHRSSRDESRTSQISTHRMHNVQ